MTDYSILMGGVVAVAFLFIVTGIAYKRPVFKNPLYEKIALWVFGKPGSEDDIDVMKFMFLALDVVFLGIAGAFIILIAACALALPNDLRAITWLGCAFVLPMIADRRPFRGLSSVAVIFLIIAVGTITLSMIAAGAPRDWLIPLNLQQLPVVLSIAIGFKFAQDILEVIAKTLVDTLQYRKKSGETIDQPTNLPQVP